jgi:pilus assembly protein Flp/PilA
MIRSSDKGQGLVEYALILVLVAVAVIAVLLILGPTIGNVFTRINNNLATVGVSGGGGSNPTPSTCVAGSANGISDTECWALVYSHGCGNAIYYSISQTCVWPYP